ARIRPALAVRHKVHALFSSWTRSRGHFYITGCAISSPLCPESGPSVTQGGATAAPGAPHAAAVQSSLLPAPAGLLDPRESRPGTPGGRHQSSEKPVTCGAFVLGPAGVRTEGLSASWRLCSGPGSVGCVTETVAASTGCAHRSRIWSGWGG